ncbi:hypothetical protein LJC14_02925 [Treponema sp. OttesenSCG-928-L16]|nr:hypothetical protein [Treponema sp. OttesenSCG-928-L16]
MNFFKQLKKTISRGLHFFSRSTVSILQNPKKSASFLSDRLLADALRLAEIPSPSSREEQRAAFVLERLVSLGAVPWVDEDGNVLARIRSTRDSDEAPLLLFADLGSSRWHPQESLTRLDADTARGAGLGDAFGTAALLSAAEGAVSGHIVHERDLLFLFTASSFDDPRTNSFLAVEEQENRPFAAIGVRGFLLGTLINHTQGSCRLTIKVAAVHKDHEAEDEADEMKAEEKHPAPVIGAILSGAAKLSGTSLDENHSIHCHIRRIEAGTGFGRVPSEGVIELDLESSDSAALEEAKNTIAAVMEEIGAQDELKSDVFVESFIPAGDPLLNDGLVKKISEIMKELHIKVREENGSDPSAFLSESGIPALSLGISRGQEGLSRDAVEIASIEKGRQLIEAVIERVTKELV